MRRMIDPKELNQGGGQQEQKNYYNHYILASSNDQTYQIMMHIITTDPTSYENKTLQILKPLQASPIYNTALMCTGYIDSETRKAVIYAIHLNNDTFDINYIDPTGQNTSMWDYNQFKIRIDNVSPVTNLL